MWKAAGTVLLLAGAVLTALTPDSPVGQAAYLACFGGLTLAAWLACLRPTAGGRRPWVLIAAALTSWLSGDVTWGVLQLTGAETDVGLQDVFWLSGYPLLGAAIISMVRRRAPGQGRAAMQDGLTLTTAALLAAWQFFIAPEWDSGAPALALVVGALYPLGDVLLFASVLFLVLSPGRIGRPAALLIAGISVMLFLDTGITLVTSSWAELDVDRLNGALLLANGLVLAPALRRDRDQLSTPVRAAVATLHPARLVFLGLAILTGPIMATTRGTLPAGQRVLLLGATTVTVGFCLARFTGAVREQARAQQGLLYLAEHDGLTGLVNRRALGERLAGDFRPGAGLALLYIDLDRFKAVNDEHGHAVGDAVLVEAARRIRGQVRADDLCARLGGDEFAVLCRGLDPPAARDLAGRVAHALAEPMVAGGTVVSVGASVGTATAADCADGDDLLCRADQAMFEAKRAGRQATRPRVA